MPMRSKISAACLAMAALVSWMGTGVQADPKEGAEQTEKKEQRRPAAAVDRWIGVQCFPIADPALRAQLALEHHEGLLVQQVVPDGPAAKAGVKQYDILLSAGGQRLHGIHELQQAVNQSGDDEMKLELLRAGKRETLSITPVERPRQPWEGPISMQDRERLQHWIDGLAQGQAPPAAFRFFHPGYVVPQEAGQLPEGMSISISRQGKEPAKITISQGDKTWEVTEDKLDELPSDVRREVEKVLHPQAMPGLPGQPNGGPIPPGAFQPRVIGPVPDQRLEQQLDHLNQQLDQLRQRLDRFEKQLDQNTPPERTRT